MVSILHRFGQFGGRYVPETLIPALNELEDVWQKVSEDQNYRTRLSHLLANFAGRPTPIFESGRVNEVAGRRVFFKREDLLHTGAHKINNAIGQALLASYMNKTRIVAETGAGQHGVATATACALLDLECVVYMGAVDMERQRPNVDRMILMGARVEPVTIGAGTLKEAVSAAIRDWVTNVETTHYVLGSAVGPAPYPFIVRELQRVIGDEAHLQILAEVGRLPDRVIACVGGGSNSIGMFTRFVSEPQVELVGVEAAGDGVDTPRHGASLSGGRPGVLHGSYSSILQDDEGQIAEAHSISAGLDYPGVGPEHAHLNEIGRAKYVAVTDSDAIDAFHRFAKLSGIIPALESSHAIAWMLANPSLDGGKESELDLVCLSGRGDKDLAQVLPRGAQDPSQVSVGGAHVSQDLNGAAK